MKSEPKVPTRLIFITSVFIFTFRLLLKGILVCLRLCLNVIIWSLILSLSATCLSKVKIDKTNNKKPNIIPIIFVVVSEVLMNGAIIRNSPPSKKKITPTFDLSHKRNLCFISMVLSSAKIVKQAWFAIFSMSLLIVVNVLLSFGYGRLNLPLTFCSLAMWRIKEA